MNYFKSIFSVMALVALSSHFSFGQMSASFSTGYGMGLSQGNYYEGRYRDNTVNNRELVKYSLGSGLNFNGIFNYGLNDNLELELGVTYLMGSKTESVDYDGRDPLAIQNDVFSISAKGLSVTPGILIKGSGEGVRPYSRLGLNLGKPSITEEITFDDGTNISYVKVEYGQGMSIGFSGAFGALYNIGSLDLFGELFINSVAYAPKFGEVTALEQDGTSIISNFDVIDLQTNYVDVLDRNKNIPNTSPNEALLQYYPLSSYGLKIGVRYNF